MKMRIFIFLSILYTLILFGNDYSTAPCDIGKEAKKTEAILNYSIGQSNGSSLIMQILENGGLGSDSFKVMSEQLETKLKHSDSNIGKIIRVLNNFNALVFNCTEYKKWLRDQDEERKKPIIKNQEKNQGKSDENKMLELLNTEALENANKLLFEIYSKCDDSCFIFRGSYFYQIKDLIIVGILGSVPPKKELSEVDILNNVKPDKTEWNGTIKLAFKFFRKKIIYDIDRWPYKTAIQSAQSVNYAVNYEILNEIKWEKWVDGRIDGNKSDELKAHLTKIDGKWGIDFRSCNNQFDQLTPDSSILETQLKIDCSRIKLD